MRYNSSNPRDKLVPLRRFAADNLYSAQYITLLVQRKKLKARKVGRNFYTCEKWFFNYLELHARDEIRIKYFKALESFDKATEKSLVSKRISLSAFEASSRITGHNANSQITDKGVGGFKGIFIKIAAGIAAVFVFGIFVMQVVFWLDSREGRVSGISEPYNIATTTAEQRN